MRFLEPKFLYLLTLIPLLLVFFYWDEKKRQKQFSQFASRSIWHAITPELLITRRILKARVWLLAVCMLILAAARPQWGTHEETAKMTGLDIVVLLDVSNSMEAEDVVPSRLKKAKHAVRSLVDRLRGDRVGLIAFAGSAYVACPLTTDIDYFLQSVEILNPESVTNQGTDIGAALETAHRLLERGAEHGNADPSAQIVSKVVLLITDGEDHENEASDYAAKLKKTATKVYVVGVGTQKGAPIPMRDANGTLRGHKRDSGGQPVVTKLIPESLATIATTSGGRYWTLSESEQEMDELLDDMGGLSRSEFAERKYLVYEDRYQYPLLLGVFLLLLEMAISLRKKIKGSILIKAMFLIFVFHTDRIYAAPLNVYLENQKGIQALQSGNLDQAKKNFGSAQARSPHLPELHFNQGIVQAGEEKFEEAIESFGNAAKRAAEGKDPQLAGKAYFNKGLGHSKKGDLAGAVDSYLKAIEFAKIAKDEQLESDARKNIELLRVNPPQSQQNNKDEDKKEDKNQQNQHQQNKDQSKDQNKDQAKQQQQPKEFKQSDQKQQGKDRREFKSKKLSAEDAERVLAQLRNKEKELQSQLKKQKVRQQQNGKDW